MKAVSRLGHAVSLDGRGWGVGEIAPEAARQKIQEANRVRTPNWPIRLLSEVTGNELRDWIYWFSSFVKSLAFGGETKSQASTELVATLDRSGSRPLGRNRLGMPCLWVHSFIPQTCPDGPLPARTVQAGGLQRQGTQSPGTRREDWPLGRPGINADHLLKSQWRSWKVATRFCEMEVLKIKK